MRLNAAIYLIGYKNAYQVTFRATFSISLQLLYVDEMLMRVGEMCAYSGHYRSFVIYIYAIYRLYIWHLN